MATFLHRIFKFKFGRSSRDSSKKQRRNSKGNAVANVMVSNINNNNNNVAGFQQQHQQQPSAKPHQIVPTLNFNHSSSGGGGHSGHSNGSASSGTNKSNKMNNVRTRRLMKEYREIIKVVDSYRRGATGHFDKPSSSSSIISRRSSLTSPCPSSSSCSTFSSSSCSSSLSPPSSSSSSSSSCSQYATYLVPFEVELVNESLYEWNIKLRGFDPDSVIYHEMKLFGIDHVLLNATFPENFPFEPPFIRVVAPIIEKGFVMEGGAICMELLTSSGWSSAYNMEAVIMQLTASFVKGQAKIKSIKKGFNKKDAEASFKSIVKTHSKYGWVDSPLSEG